MHKKQIFKIDVLKKLLEDKNNCISLVPCTRVLALPPFYLNDLKLGVVCLLNSFLKKYDRALDGILIGYQNIVIKMDENSGIIPMGAAEIEINVSVEFYIFQPKIGSHLEAVVNKTSQNHIGCLVHKYFNATILKPEDVDHENWICKNYKEGDKIIFKVKDLDFTGVLPYIEGIMDEEIVSKQMIFQCDTNKRSPQKDCKEISKEESIEKDIFNSLFNSKVKKENRNEEEDDIDEDLDDTLHRLISKNLEVVESGSEKNKKKKKKEKEKKSKKSKEVIVNPTKSIADEGKDLTDFAKISTKYETSTNVNENKKKKKKKDKDKDRDKFEVLTQILPEDVFGVHYVEDNKEIFPKKQQKDNKLIHKSKKKEKRTESFSVAAESPKKSECPMADLKEDSVFHSTQLESKASDRFIMPFCSPILQTDTIKKKEKKQKLPQSIQLKDLKEKVDKSEKKLSKKRKRDDSEDDSVSKKPNLGIKSPVKIVETNGHVSSEEKLETQSLLVKIYQEQMNRLKECWKEEDNFEQKKEKSNKKVESKSNSRKEKKGSKKMESKLSERINEKVSEIPRQEDEKDSKIFHKLSQEKEKEVSRKVGDSPKKVNKKIENKLLEPKEEKVEKSSEKEDKIISNIINDLLKQKKNEIIEGKLSVQKGKNVNESFKQEKEEINEKVKTESIKLKNEANLEINDRLSVQKEKKVSEDIRNKSPKKLEKKVSKKTESKTLQQNGENDSSLNGKRGSELSLVEKLLQEVKSSVNGGALDDVDSTKSGSKKKKKKKENVGSSENKAKDVIKKEKSERKRKRKEKGDENLSKKVKYEKNHISKTNGSGSETSSNQIKIKQMNGEGTNKTKCSIQTSLDDFFSKNSEKSDQDSEGSKEKKKNKDKEKKDAGQESLIEKLLREARKSLKLKSESPSKSKSEKKKEEKEK